MEGSPLEDSLTAGELTVRPAEFAAYAAGSPLSLRPASSSS